MSKIFNKKYKFVPENPRNLRSMDTLILPLKGNSPGSGLFLSSADRKLIEALNHCEMGDLDEYIEELEDNDEKDN